MSAFSFTACKCVGFVEFHVEFAIWYFNPRPIPKMTTMTTTTTTTTDKNSHTKYPSGNLCNKTKAQKKNSNRIKWNLMNEQKTVCSVVCMCMDLNTVWYLYQIVDLFVCFVFFLHLFNSLKYIWKKKLIAKNFEWKRKR